MLSLLYLSLGIYIIISQIINYIKTKELDYFTFFCIFFLFYYIVPAYVHCTFPNYISRYSYAISHGNETIYAFILISISFFCVKWNFKKRFYIKEKGNKNNNQIIKRYISNEDLFFKRTSQFLLILGIISFLLHCYLYGGIIKTLTNSALIRDNQVGIVNNSWLSFITRFTVCLMYSSYIVYIRYINKRTNIINLALSVFGALLYLIVHAGRGAILTYIITMVLIKGTISKKKIKPKKIIILFIIVLFGINFIRPLLASMSSLNNGIGAFRDSFLYRVNNMPKVSFDNLLYNFCYNLEHKYVSLEVAIKSIRNKVYSYNFFIDVVIALISIIPDFLLPFKKPKSIDYYNTILIKGVNYDTGIVPPGGVAFGYYAFDFIGVIIFSIIIGILGRKLVNFFDSFNSKYLDGIKIINLFVWIDFFINGELKESVIRYFVFLCLLIIIFIVSKKEVKEFEITNKKI